MRALLLAVLTLGAAAPPAAAGWRAPVPGAVVGAFTFSPARPYAAGLRRGLDLAATPGARVRAPCGGRVTFAGALPAAGGPVRGVALRCGRLVATVLGLSTVAVRRGARLAAGEGVGRAAGVIRLGARRAGERHGYVDPAALLAAPDAAPPALAPAARRRPAPPARIVPRAAVPADRGVPLLAWAGLALAAAGIGGGVLRGRRGRRGRRVAALPAPGPLRSGR